MEKITILLAGALLLATCLGGCGKTDTLTEKEQALSAYQEILKASPAIEGEHDELLDASFDYDKNLELFGSHYDQFAVVDINHDDIPELIALSTINFRWAPISIFTFEAGKAVLLKDPLAPEAHGTFEQMSTANGAYITYICGNNHIHNVWRGTTPIGEIEEQRAYALDGAILTEVDCSAGQNENTTYFSDIAKVNTTENVNAMILN